MQYLLYFLTIPFLYFNYKIVISDLKYKKIPNKYLGFLFLLIPFYYIYIYWNFPDINYILFIWQILLTFIISFLLFYFWLWAAWDAKYLLVLSLFIPYIWIIPFIWNIAILTIFYLIWYFIYFYFWKLIFNKKYRKNLYSSIKEDLNQTWENHKWNKWWNTYKIISKFIIIFFIIFISIRLLRISIFSKLLENWNNIQKIIENYNIYLMLLLIWIFLLILYVWKILRLYIWKIFKLNSSFISNVFLALLSIALFSFIFYELYYNYNEITNLLFQIFSFYLILYLIIKIIIYSYKITFWIWEVYYKNIDDLKNDDIVDKEYLIKNKLKYLNIEYIKNKSIIIPKEIVEKMKIDDFRDSIIDNNIKKIISYYDIINKVTKLYKKNNIDLKENKKIKVLRTFSFGPYVFAWFIISFLLWNKILTFIINNIFSLFNIY